MPNLELFSVSHAYQKDQPILEKVSISAEQGEIICIIGKSGCGKSTILKLIAGIETPQNGEIYIDKECVAGKKNYVPPEKRAIGIVFQEPSLFPHKRVIDNVIISIDSKISKKEKIQRAMNMLKNLDMEKYAKFYPHTLSVGQQQKVAIARALVQQAKIMLLDEPFASLDGLSKQKIISQVLPILKSQKITIVLVTHDPTEALTIANRIYVLQNKTIVQSGSAMELYYRPRTLFVANFFGQLNRIEGTMRNSRVETIFGSIEVDTNTNVGTLADDTKVLLCIRPEAFSVAQDGKISAVVQEIIFLGMTSLVYADTINGEIYGIRINSDQLPKVGEKINLKLDTSKTFIFAEDVQ
jgi:iron(III) transport system ATP-binding protein